MGALGLIRALPLAATLAATGWALSSNPLAAPLVERSAADLSLTLERMVRRTATEEWLSAAMAEAVAAEDAERAEMLVGLAEDLGRDVDTVAARALIEEAEGWTATVAGCGTCMLDIATCPSLSQLTFCAVPFELSPAGDLNALRRAAFAWTSGGEVDALDAGLALVGLGATAAILVTGGSSATVKAGTGLLRLARRMGSLTPGLARVLRVPVKWDAVPGYLLGRVPLDRVTDVARLNRVGAVAADLGRVREATSTAETLRLVRLVDTPEDATRLARVAEAAGPRTTRTFATLGKTRAFRATLRLSRTAIGALVLLWLTALQIALILATRAGALTLRVLASKAVDRGARGGQS